MAGFEVITEVFKDRDTFNRQSAAFAFDEFTERIEGRPPKITATPEIITAAIAAFPAIAEALQDRDEIVRCMSYEALEQARRSRHDLLRASAERLLQGVTVRCRVK